MSVSGSVSRVDQALFSFIPINSGLIVKGVTMKKNYLFPRAMITIVFALMLSSPAMADKFTDTIEIFKKSEATQPFFESAYGLAVFPTVGKAGIGIGGSYGKGQVYRDGELTGETSLIKATIGLQLGGQAFSEIIFFEDKRAYDDYTSGNFEFDASASAVAITAGIQATAGTGGTSAGASAGPATGTQAQNSYHNGMAVFVHIKGGLMYEASIGGQKFSFTAKE
jgi:lipid-binding SYLF domain-containing protein